MEKQAFKRAFKKELRDNYKKYEFLYESCPITHNTYEHIVSLMETKDIKVRYQTIGECEEEPDYSFWEIWSPYDASIPIKLAALLQVSFECCDNKNIEVEELIDELTRNYVRFKVTHHYCT